MKNSNSINRIIQVNDINIWVNIRSKRIEKGLKQTDIVKLLQLNGVDISVFSYNRIEKESQNPTVSFLIIICDILGCDMNAIFYTEN